MSSDPQSASPSSGADQPPADPELAELVRLRGAPLLDALEAHSPGSRDHAEATGAHTFAAAVGIGLDRTGAELCRETARLHDVGMVYVPVSVMQTPFETWGSAEREAFDSHYEAGARLALGAGIPDDVCGWLLRIRERFDGLGPEGLAGEAIPIAARLIRAACACATLLASARGDEPPDERRADAIPRLLGAAGRELDPQIVDALVAAVARPGAG
jgi:HD-GYP domain-containing protein (c-di-GMP phosphodiesterase class II)